MRVVDALWLAGLGGGADDALAERDDDRVAYDAVAGVLDAVGRRLHQAFARRQIHGCACGAGSAR